ncbi:hypothetical protein MNV49_002146 [Pseudohyphozyma bogoriensis]|nr:hypothetical protein MNV49_002146 [Pseudohyphozyma bogoriensis]
MVSGDAPDGGIAGYFCFPGFPDRPNPLAKWYLPEEAYVAARRRVDRLGRQNPKPLTFRRFGRVFLRWELWILGVLCWDVNTTGYASGFFNLWLKSLTKADGTKLYSVAQLNYIPIAGSAVQLVWTIALARTSDWTGRRLPFLIFNSLVVIFSGAILIARFYILWSWISDVAAYSSDLRTVIYATGTTTRYLYDDLPPSEAKLTPVFHSYILSATIPPAAFQSSLAPNWPIGAKLTVGVFAFGIFVFIGTAKLVEWQRKRQEGWKDGTSAVPKQKGFFPVQGRSD